MIHVHESMISRTITIYIIFERLFYKQLLLVKLRNDFLFFFSLIYILELEHLCAEFFILPQKHCKIALSVKVATWAEFMLHWIFDQHVQSLLWAHTVTVKLNRGQICMRSRRWWVENLSEAFILSDSNDVSMIGVKIFSIKIENWSLWLREEKEQSVLRFGLIKQLSHEIIDEF